jgi:hypothetical protein
VTTEEKVLALIHTGTRQKPITIAEIGVRTLLSPRAIKKIVRKLRRDNAQISSSKSGINGGYYIADSAEDLERAAADLEHQAKDMLVTAGVLRERLRIREMVGQQVVAPELARV